LDDKGLEQGRVMSHVSPRPIPPYCVCVRGKINLSNPKRKNSCWQNYLQCWLSHNCARISIEPSLTIMSSNWVYTCIARRVLPEKLGGGVQPASQTPYPTTKICDFPYALYDLKKFETHLHVTVLQCILSPLCFSVACSKESKSSPYLCLDATYIVALLKEGFGFKENRRLTVSIGHTCVILYSLFASIHHKHNPGKLLPSSKASIFCHGQSL